MPDNYSIRFVLYSIIAGLLASVVILLVYPEIIQSNPHGGNHNSAHLSSYSEAVAKAAPAVVNVYASRVLQPQVNPLLLDPLFQRFFGQPQPPNKLRDSNLGSGVIMNKDGIILTNAHVIQGKDDIRVTLIDGRQPVARIIGIDPDTDLAVLQIELTDFTPVTVGDSDELKVGDVVLAIGNPYDVGQTVTQGIVSAKKRKRMGITTFEDFIQTDADINPGNSGGALITADGLLVGINTAIVSNTGVSLGIGLATPINLALEVMQQLIRHGYVVRGWLGIEAQILPHDIQLETGLKNGVLVAGTLTKGPADQAGMIPGDILLQVADKPVSDPQQVIEMISGIKPGTVIDLTIMRGWEQMKLRATIAERPQIQR